MEERDMNAETRTAEVETAMLDVRECERQLEAVQRALVAVKQAAQAVHTGPPGTREFWQQTVSCGYRALAVRALALRRALMKAAAADAVKDVQPDTNVWFWVLGIYGWALKALRGPKIYLTDEEALLRAPTDTNGERYLIRTSPREYFEELTK
jgi:hypothetical protein